MPLSFDKTGPNRRCCVGVPGSPRRDQQSFLALGSPNTAQCVHSLRPNALPGESSGCGFDILLEEFVLFRDWSQGSTQQTPWAPKPQDSLIAH